MRKIKKVLIIERNEMGLRALEICVKMKINFVVGFSGSDSTSVLVKKARAYCATNQKSGLSYLGEDLHDSYGNVTKIIATAQLWKCDAVYPGYNILSENHVAVEKITRAGLLWIGPSTNVIKLFSHRYATRELAKKYNLDVFDAFLIISKKQLLKNCQNGKITFPFMMKTFASGGGRGNNIISDARDLENNLTKIDTRTKNYYAEKYVSGRHIELQFVANGCQVKYLGTRDCSCQIKFQKILEEGPANIEKSQLATLENRLTPLLLDLKYRGLGTAEFVYAPKENKFYFLEINPRIQVESPVTEELFDIDLVATQFTLAQDDGTALRKEYSTEKKYAIEARVYARDPYDHFAQSVGMINLFKTAKINSITYHTGYQVGDVISNFYDPLLLKVVSSARNRASALQKLKQALQALQINGVTTNKDLLLWLLAQKEFKNKTLTQDFIESAWQKHLSYLQDDKRKFLATGIFQEVISTEKINPQKLINTLKYSRNGVQRNYLAELNSKHADSPQKTAFRFGIFHRDKLPVIFAWWDFSYFGGTLGVDETLALEKCFALARKKKLPLVMSTRSGGARQQENTLALAMMQYILHAYEKNGRPFFINIFDQENFGGLNASLTGLADIKIATATAKIGLTGPKFLAAIMSDGETLPLGAQGAQEHYTARNIDELFPDLYSACESAFGLCRFVCDKSEIEKLSQKKIPLAPQKTKSMSVSACLKYLNNPKRLRFADIINPKTGIFSDIKPLSNFASPDNLVYLPIMGALARIGKHRVMIIGQQSIGKNGNILSPSAKDFKWMRRKMQLAEKLDVPIILLGDTNGADASLDSEYAGVSHEISQALLEQTKLSVPIISINLGLCGSGGGLPFVNLADAAAALERSLKMVSDIRVQGTILSGNDHLTSHAQKKLLDMLQDATAKGQFHYGLIDEIIPHSSNKKILAENIKNFIVKSLNQLTALSKKELLVKRLQRQEKIKRNLLTK